MKILFKKITQQKSDFNLSIDKLEIEGVYYREAKIICIDAKIYGSVPNICFSCGNDFMQTIKEELNLKISQNEYADQEDEELLDIIEVFNDKICFNEIFTAEIASIVGDYHACENCK